MSTRGKHIEFCKERALEYLERNSKFYNPSHALASMMSDMRKHEETAKMLDGEDINFVLSVTLSDQSHENVKKFIEGFM